MKNRKFNLNRKKEFQTDLDNLTEDEKINQVIKSIVGSLETYDNRINETLNKKISNFEKNEHNHTIIVLKILFQRLENLEIKHQEIILVYSRRWFDRSLLNNNSFSSVEVEEIIKKLIDLMISERIVKKNSLKDIIKTFFTKFSALCYKENQKSKFQDFYENIVSLISIKLRKCIEDSNFDSLIFYINTLESTISNQNFLIYDNEIFNNLMLLSYEVIIKLNDFLMKNTLEVQLPDNKMGVSKLHVFLLNMTNLFVTIINENFISLKKVITNQNTKLFYNNQYFLKVMTYFLNLNPNMNDNEFNLNFVIVDENLGYLNKFKSIIVDCFIKIIDFMKKNTLFTISNEIISAINELCTHSIRTLDIVIKENLIKDEINPFWKEIEFNNIIMKYYLFVCSCIPIPQFSKIFLDNKIE